MPNIPSMTQPTSGGQDDLSAAEAEDDEAADSERESDRQMYGEDDMDPSSHPAYVVEDEDEDELLAEPPRGGSGQRGRNGLRTAAASSSSSAPKSSPLEPAKARGAPAGSDDKSKSQRKPRGNLPPAPAFDGDKKKDPKCFRKWSAKVDSYVEIAKNIIDDSEIGLRLHAALDGDAADYLEDIPARTFGVEKGWQVLLRVLKEKFDEKRMHKVGSAMRGFFRLNLGDKSYSMLEVADAMDKAARRCREANLTIPDEIMIYFFFEHTQSSTERQANLLLRTGGEYNWKKMKAAVELLYQNVNVRTNTAGGRDVRDRGGRGGRAAHEAHIQQSPISHDYADLWKLPGNEATEEQVENWIYDLDPVEQLASAELEEIPEDLARELHLCFATHRENRQKLARAVQARGFYVGQKGKGKGKSKYDSKGKSKDGKGKKGGGGKARGMSLEELKSKTQCADCGQRGHWRGDPQCKGARSNNAVQRDGLDDDDEAQDWYEDYDRDVEYPSWAAERYGYEAHRSSYVSARREPGDDRDRRAEAEAVARGVDRVRRKAEPSAPAVNADQVKAQLTSDTFLDAEAVKSRIQSMHRPHMTPSQAPELVAEAFRHFGLEPVPSGRKGVRELLDEDTPGPDIESLRRALVTRRADFSLERAVCSSSRRPPTVEPNRLYLTLDTACENTVAGVTLLRSYAKQLETNYGVHVKIEAESEHYCFGPGPPLPSKERWSFPLGIGGEQAVIHTSAVEDTHSPKVPFLAGQDWMKFMDACLDIGRDRALLREIGIEVPLFVDTTGHLVIAIDEFPAGGWAAGLKPQKEGYAGATFGASDVAATAFAARKETVLPDVSQVACGTTHFYVPCKPKNSARLTTSPTSCTVPNDYWEFKYDTRIFVRHHCRPRVALFEPQDAIDGPDPESLQPLRVTVCSALPVPLRDEWGGQSASLQEPWVGRTYFFGVGRQYDLECFPPAEQHVVVTLADGQSVKALPSEILNPQVKKIHHVDVSAAKPPGIPPSRRKGTYRIPQGESIPTQHSGFRPLQKPAQKTLGDATPHAPGEGNLEHRRGEEDAPSGAMVRRGDEDAEHVRRDGQVGAFQQEGHGYEVPLSGSHGLRAGHRAGGKLVEDDPGYLDSTSSEESEAGGAASACPVSDAPREVPTSAPHGPQDGEHPWPFPGVCSVRHSVERGAVPHPGRRGHGDGVSATLGPQRHSGRQDRQGQGGVRLRAPGRGVFRKFVHLLLLLAGLHGGGLQGRQEGQQGQGGWAFDSHELEEHCTDAVFRAYSDDIAGQHCSLLRPPDLRPRAGRQVHGADAREGGGQFRGGAGVEYGRGHGGELGGGSSGTVDVGGGALKRGQVKRMMSRARQALAGARMHRSLVEDRLQKARWPRKRFGCDLLEVFGGTSMISVRATAHWGMRVLQPIDIRCGCDLKKPKERQWLLRVLDRLDPRLVVVAIPCTAWSVSQADEELALRREYVQPFAKLADDVFRSQRRRGGHAVAESPATSHGFQKAEYQLRQDLYETASCVSMPQLTDKNGRLGQKRLRFVATHPYFTWALDRQCATTVAYPPALADAICQAYWEVVAQEDYGFATTWEAVRAVHYVDVKRDEAGWRDMLTQAQELLGRKNQASLLIPPGTDFHSKIERLVPWQILSVQIAHLPKAKRVKAGLEESHRASVLLLNDDSVQIETEYIRECQAPRERFVTPVRYAIFVLGHAPGEPSGPASARPPTRQPLPAEPGENVVEPGQMVQDVIHEGMIQEGVVQQSFAGEIWFIGGPLKEKEKAIARSLVRAHRNLGHPRAEDFTRALAQNYRVSPEAISLSRRLRCATCERTKRPHPPRPSSLKMTGPFNSRVCLDFVHLHDADKEGHWFLHIVEPNGSFNVFYPVESRNPEHVFETFCNIWASWAGWPDAILVDQDGGFGAYFAEQLVNVGTEIEHIAAEAHWQAGQVETFNRAFRYAAAKLIDEHHITGRLGMKMLASSVGASMNDRVRTSGCSANEWVFGKHPKVPVDLLSPDGKLQALQGMDADQELRLRQQIRASADAKLAEFSVNQSLSKAILRLGRPTRQSYEPGELVAFWREARTRKDPKTRKPRRLPAGWCRGSVIGPHRGDEGQSNYWVTSNGRCLLVAKEQLRPAFGTEVWRIQEEDMQQLLDNPPEEFLDIRAEVPDGEAGAPGEVIPFFDDNIEDAPNELPGLDAQAAAGEGEHREGDRPLPERYEHGTGSLCGSDRTQPSPTAREDRPSGLEEPEAKRFRSEVVEVDTPEPELDEAAEAALEAALGKGVNITTVYVPVSVEELFAKPSQPFQESVLAAGTRAACATRKEAKALEKEIPFNQIPFEQKDSYAAALQKEWDTWTKYAAVEILSPHASQVVLEQYDSSRILDTRVCYRNKNAAYPWLPLKAKARLVCRGDRDPDLLTLRRDAPTLTRLGLMVILQIAASLPSWFLFNADVTGAFLQGDQSLASRKEPLFLRQPREGLPGLVAGQILLVVRGIFGLANSPRLFWRHLRDTLLKLGFVQSVLDKALFAYYHLGQLVLLMGAHVDDLIGAGEPGGRADEVLAKVKEAFDFGSWADSRTDEVLEYGGKQVRRLPDGRVQLTQEKFIQATNLTPVPKWRSIQPNSELTGRETTELRSAGGCLHWLIGQTRPDLAAGTSLFMSGKPTVSNLLEINKLLKEAKKSQDWGLCFSPVPLDQAKVVVFSDASWANAEGLKSQAGYLSFLTGPDVFSPGGDTASLMDWRSHRIQRQCRSTLAAETMSLDTAFDSGIFLRELLAEVLLESYSPVQSGALPKDFLPVHPVTDCRSLYDLLVKDGPVSATQEKRLTIDLGAIKQSAEEFDPEDLKGTFKWVDTSRQLADHLTKLKPSYQLREHLEQGWLALQVDVQNDARDQGSHPAS